MSTEEEKPEFQVGDFVYYAKDSIGQITDVVLGNNGDIHHYRVDYCQSKDPDEGVCGGNGPIWKIGFPKKVTEPVDVLFVAAVKERSEADRLRKKLAIAEDNFKALKRAVNILNGGPTRRVD